MKKTQKKSSIAVAACGVALLLLLLTSNFGAVLAKPDTNETLPDFLERLLLSLYSNATSAELNLKRIEWANQLKMNEEYLKKAPQLLASWPHYYMVWADKEYWGGGMVYDEDNIIGSDPDGYIARLYTPYVGGVANIFGEMSSQYAWGYVHAYAAERGQRYDGKDNYLICMASNNLYAPPGEWTFIGYKKITSMTPTWWAIGFNPNSFRYWCFGCNAMGGDCMYNYISVDCVAVTPIV